MIPHRRHALGLLTLVALAAPCAARAQAPDEQNRDRAHRMLGYIRDDLKEYYYDSTFGGLDLDAHFRRADSSLDAAPTIQELLGVIAQFLLDLKDSHTSFIPPPRAASVEYGWAWMMVGDGCFVTAVAPGSDAEKKGLARGDQVLAIDGMLPTRQSIHIIDYLYNSLNPRPGMHVAVRKPDGAVQEFDVLAKITPGIRVADYTSMWDRNRMYEQSLANLRSVRHRTRSFGDTAMVWRMRSFIGGDEQAIDDFMDDARHHKTLILDLRNNSGGYVSTMLRLIGHFVDRETRVSTSVHRDKREPEAARPVRRTPFTGNLIILLNSQSASASEVTSRFLQLEGKATIVGDRSMGAVMTSIVRRREVGFTKLLPFGASITISDVIMGDGNRIENVGVMPEFIVLPTGADMLARRDPQMAKALQLAGIQMSPEDAAKIFEVRPRP